MANQNRRIQRQIKASIKKPKAGAKAKPGASEAKPIKVREGEKVAVVRSSTSGSATWGIGARRPWPACGR